MHEVIPGRGDGVNRNLLGRAELLLGLDGLALSLAARTENREQGKANAAAG
jgi:hypothetical protein